jgi:hypothetical protein
MQKIQIRLTVATTILMILFNLSHSCCAQEIDDEPDSPKNEKSHVYAESNCPECEIFDGKNCIPDPRKQLPPNTPSTGIECCGSTPVPVGLMCCQGKIFKEDPYSMTLSLNFPEVEVYSKLPIMLTGSVAGKSELKYKCCGDDILRVSESSYSGDIKLSISGGIPLGPGSLVISIEGGVTVDDDLAVTCEDRNPCFNVNLSLTGSADWGPGWNGYLRIAAGIEIDSTLPYEICAKAEAPYFKIEPQSPEGCTRVYAKLETPKGELEFFQKGILGSCSVQSSSSEKTKLEPTPNPRLKPLPAPSPPNPTPNPKRTANS